MRNTFFRYFMAAFVLYALSIGALAQVKAFDTSRMDRNADACDDFFEFANGTWVKNTEIPPSETRWGTFNILIDQNTNYLHEILENAATVPLRVGKIDAPQVLPGDRGGLSG